MKKLTALALAMILAISLCIPATAYSDAYTEGYDEGWSTGYDVGYADFEAGKQSAQASADNREGGKKDGYKDGYVEGYEAAKRNSEVKDADYEKGYSDGYAAGYADYQKDEYNYPVSADYDSHYDVGYSEGYDAGYSQAWDEDNAGGLPGDATTVSEEIAGCGGVPGAINVKLDDACIAFGSVRPVNKNGRVMVPVRAILEALGAKVAFDDTAKTVTATLNGETLRHQIGTETVEVYSGAGTDTQPSTVVMDCKSYIQGGRTMVPVRFISEALGYEVEWDGDYQTVAVLDMAKLRKTYDSQLTVLNLMLSDGQKVRQSGKTYRQDANMGLDLTLFDTLNGDKRLSASGTATSLFNESGANATVKMDLTQVVDLLEKTYQDYTSDQTAKLTKALRNLRVDMIYNGKTGQVYVKSPVIQAMLDQDTWVESSLLEMMGVGTGQTAAASLLNVGSAATVTDIVLAASAGSAFDTPFHRYEGLVDKLDGMVASFGDKMFTKSGATYTYNADKKTLLDWAGNNLYYLDIGSAGSLDLGFTVTDTGSGTCNYSCKLYFRSDEMQATLDYAKRGTSEDMTVGVHVKNTFRATLTAGSAMRESSETVQTMPPAAELTMTLDQVYS